MVNSRLRPIRSACSFDSVGELYRGGGGGIQRRWGWYTEEVGVVSPGTGGIIAGRGAGSALGRFISFKYFCCRSCSFCLSCSNDLALCTTCACTFFKICKNVCK